MKRIRGRPLKGPLSRGKSTLGQGKIRFLAEGTAVLLRTVSVGKGLRSTLGSFRRTMTSNNTLNVSQEQT